MSLFTRIFGRREAPAPVKRESGDAEHPTPPTPRQGGVLWPFISNGTALSIATVYRCVKLLSESVAALPVQVMRRKGGIFVDDLDSRLSFLLNVQPNEFMSAFDLWQQAVQLMLLRGNAYIVPVYSVYTMDFERFVLCSDGAVAHNTVSGEYIVNDLVNGIQGTYPEDEVIHIKGLSLFDQRMGVSVLEFARLTTNIAEVGDRETFDRFKNGGNVRGLVGNDTSVRGFGEYQDAELAKTAEDLDSQFHHGKHIVSLPGQVDFKQLSLSSTDLQFLESRKFTVREICRFFGVPPSFVFDDTSNNYKSAEMANVAFLSNTLNPLLRNIEAELQRKLFLPSQYGRKRIQFDRRGLYACDLDSRVKYQTATIAAGLYTVNEWRAEENKPSVEGGDKVLVSANLKGIDELTAAPAPAETKNPENNEE